MSIDPFRPREILHSLNIVPKKYLGQNFIIDKNIASRLISEASLDDECIVLEVGPGLGALTSLLVEKAKLVHAVEIDQTFFNFLKENTSSIQNLNLIYGDIIKIETPSHDKVVSNIPYTITGPLISKLLFKENPPELYLIIEKAIADRIIAAPNSKPYSRLSVSVNTFAKPTIIMKVQSRSFYPAPKIDLAMIKLVPHEKLDVFLLDANNREIYLNLLRGVFPYKNKDSINALFLYLKNNRLSKNDVAQFLKEKQKSKKIRNLTKLDFLEIAEKLKLSEKLNSNSE